MRELDYQETAPLSTLAFQLLFEASPHPYLIVRPDPAFTIVAANDRYLAATATRRDNIVGHGLFEVFPDNPDDHSVSGVGDLRASLERVLRDRAPDVMGVQKYDIPRRDHAGAFALKYWSPVNTPVFGENGEILFIIHHVEDVTEFVLMRERTSRERAERIEQVQARADRMGAEVLRRATQVTEANRQLKVAMDKLERREAELARLNERLKEADRVKTEFFANVSHEFRTPLTLILGPIKDILDKPAGEDSADSRASLEAIYRNASRLLKLVNTLLEFSRIEAGRAQPVWQQTELGIFTADLAANFRSACDRAGLELIVDCPPLPQPATVDRSMWERIVLNLVSNAFKFTFKGTIEVRLRAAGDQAELMVRDTGTGIPRRELPHLFERFRRIEGFRGRSDEGSGIGLALVDELVRLHGGSIQVESEEGRGSTFVVRLPLNRNMAAQPAGGERLPGQPPGAPLSVVFAEEASHWLLEGHEPVPGNAEGEIAAAPVRGRVLVADDNADMRGYIRRLLEAAGYSVETVADGDAALTACRAHPPDLLVTDVMMPGLSGVELLERLRAEEHTATLPIILLSAQAGEEARAAGLVTGADDYLVKPFLARELTARVDGAIRLARLRSEAAEALRKAAAENEDLYENAPCGYHSLDHAGVLVRINRAELDWLGYAREEVVGKAFSDLLTPESRRAFEQDFLQLKDRGRAHGLEYEMVRKDGAILPVLLSATGVRDANGAGVVSRWTVFDYTDRKLADERLRQAAAVFANTDEAIMITGPDQTVVAVNRAFTEITGFQPEEVVGRNPRFQKSGLHDESFYREIWRSLDARGQWQGELRNKRKNGEIYPVWENISRVKDNLGRLVNYISIFSDISVIKQAEERMTYLAHHDALTGLPNRLLFAARLEQALEQQRRRGRKIALLLLDLDRFKLVNDTLGHAFGDQLLQAVARRLKRCVRAEDTVARLGGDEFAIVLEELAHPPDAALVATKIGVELAEPITLDGKQVVTSASIGMSVYPDDAQNGEDLVKAADAAMYRAKERGRHTFEFYTPELTKKAHEHLTLEHELRQALARGEFLLHYQPQIELATGQIKGVEALLRWRHPRRGLLLPDEFISVAEETGLIEPIGDWVLREASAQAAAWFVQGVEPIRMAVNVSARQMLYDHLVATVKRSLHRLARKPEHLDLEIEITESVLQSVERGVTTLRTLKGLGVTIAIDDFGTGYSSLSRLKHLPVDTLKIGHMFIRNVPTDVEDTAIASTIISIGRHLGLRVVAEGVETPEQLAFLRAQRCDEAQGHLLCEAVDAFEAARVLRSGHIPLSALA